MSTINDHEKWKAEMKAASERIASLLNDDTSSAVVEGNVAGEATKIRITVDQGFDIAGVDYFADPNCNFSDPSGVGSSLPITVTAIFSRMVETVSSHSMAGDNTENQALSVVMYNKMRAILPPHANQTPPCIMLFLLTKLGTYLGAEKRKDEFELGYYGHTSFDTANFVGLRQINGGRLEIFMNDKKRPHGCFNAVLKRMLIQFAKPRTPLISDDTINSVRKCVVKYCNYLAKLDCRIEAMGYAFRNHAIIMSYGGVNAQDIHIDLDIPEQYQFGVLLTADSPPTLEYRPRLAVLAENTSLDTIWQDIPEGLDEILRKNPTTQHDLNCYGCLFSDPVKVDRDLQYQANDQAMAGGVIPVKDLFPTGTVISLPGRVAHGGPKTKSFRAVIFFTGSPCGVAHYDSDKQANRTMLVGNMLLHSWLDMTLPQRVYLLRKWYEACLSKDEFAVENLVHIHLKKLGRCLQWEKKSQAKRSELIKKFANHIWKEDSWNNDDAAARAIAFQFPPKYIELDD